MTQDINDHPVDPPADRIPPYVDTPPRHKGLRIFIWSLVLLAIVLVAVLIYSHREADLKKAAATVPTPGINITTATAQKGNIGVYLDSIGTVTPVYTDSITSQVTGLVVAVHFTEGQRVNKGDPLIDIDSRPYRATLLQAQGALERDQNLLAQAQMDLEALQRRLATQRHRKTNPR